MFKDLLALTIMPEILTRILFCPETLDVETQKISKYAQWVCNRINMEEE